MSLFPLPIEQFGGLDLINAPDEIGLSGAIDLLNVDFDKPGRLRSRDGTQQFSSRSDGYNAVRLLLPASSGGSAHYLARSGATLHLDAFKDTGFVTSIAGTNGAIGVTPYGGLSAGSPVNRAYIVSGAGFWKYDGSTFTAIAGPPTTGDHLAVSPWDNRLVVGNAESKPGKVRFSDPGAPETFGANNFIFLTPGDNDTITAMCAWHNMVIVFKSRRFFVFYGTTVDGTGKPIFNYRTIDSGVGALQSFGGQSCCPTPYGVYFVGIDGIYRTTGAEPELMSGPLAPWFRGETLPYFGMNAIKPSTYARASGMAWHKGRLHVTINDATGSSVHFVHDPSQGTWSVYNTNANELVSVDLGNGPELHFGVSGSVGLGGTANEVRRFVSGVTSDTGNVTVPVTARYQSGFSSLTYPGRSMMHYTFGQVRKKIRKWRVNGTGSLSFSVAHDFGSQGTASNLTLGTAPTAKDAWHNVATRGKNFSYKISSTSAFTVNSLTAYLAGSEPVLLGNPSDK